MTAFWASSPPNPPKTPYSNQPTYRYVRSRCVVFSVSRGLSTSYTESSLLEPQRKKRNMPRSGFRLRLADHSFCFPPPPLSSIHTLVSFFGLFEHSSTWIWEQPLAAYAHARTKLDHGSLPARVCPGPPRGHWLRLETRIPESLSSPCH